MHEFLIEHASESFKVIPKIKKGIKKKSRILILRALFIVNIPGVEYRFKP
jgi:hypothetical protein